MTGAQIDDDFKMVSTGLRLPENSIVGDYSLLSDFKSDAAKSTTKLAPQIESPSREFTISR